MDTTQLLHEIVPPNLRPGWFSLGVPIHEEAVVIGGDRGAYKKGRVCVRLDGSPVNRVEIWRQDDETILGDSGQRLQVEIIKQDETIKEWPVFARPLGSLVLNQTGDHIWLATTGEVKVLEEGGLNWFGSVLMSFVMQKQIRPDFRRPDSTSPEL